MRAFFLVVLLVSMLTLLLTSVGTAVLALLAPLVMAVAAMSAVLLGGIESGLKLMSRSATWLEVALQFVRDTARVVFGRPQEAPLLDDAEFPRFSVQLEADDEADWRKLEKSLLPAFETAPVDEIWLSPDSSLGLATVPRAGKRHRVLVVGLTLAKGLPPEQLRALLAHAYAHAEQDDEWLVRWGRRFMLHLHKTSVEFSWASPLRWWATLVSYMVKLGFVPFSFVRELRADWRAAEVAGARELKEAIRWLKREAPADSEMTKRVVDHVVKTDTIPRRFSEALQQLKGTLPPFERHRLGARPEGDPFALGLRTHPSTKRRLEQLEDAPRSVPLDLPHLRPATLKALDERLTPLWLEGQGRVVEVEAFLDSMRQPVARDGAPVRLIEPMAPVEGDAPLELDVNRRWWSLSRKDDGES